MRMISLESAVQAVPKGCYVVAVSGGVDSMALLDALRRRTDVRLIVAHVNHGIRPDAHLDEKLVESYCKSHNITFVSKELHLGAHASEELARTARYKFLQHCRVKCKADAIITAHHQDDLVETAIINMLRGTGWRGIAPFTSSELIIRPLLYISKDTLVTYAQTHRVPTHEDSTNNDQRYLRNYVRHTVIPNATKVNPYFLRDLLQLIRKQTVLRRTIQDELARLLTLHIRAAGNTTVSRRYIWCMLPRSEGYELFQAMVGRITGNSLVRALAESGLLFAKAARPGKAMPLNDAWQLRVTRTELIVEPRLSVVQ